MGAVCHLLYHGTGLVHCFSGVSDYPFIVINMMQEIITYVIVAVAVMVALRLLYRNLSGFRMKRRRGKNALKSSAPGDCGSCVADCPLRNSLSGEDAVNRSCYVGGQEVKDS